MRGTGCSGGSYDYFEPLQSLDGYDVIETVARQPWVLHHKVGMMGVSYGGISQLFVAATDPPDLAAITPLSVIDNTATTLYPGGILNSGFALSWAQQRVQDALPASSTGGEPWALARIQAGDRICQANQVLHGEAVNLIAKVHANAHYVPAVADPLAPITFVHKIRVPVYLGCQFTDEQTGAHCPALVAHFTGTRRKWFTFTNGTHIDSLDPASFTRWYDFLSLFVARRAPRLSAAEKASAPAIFAGAMGVPGVTLPADPIQAEPSYGAALSAFEALPPVRILFDNGAGSATAGAPVAAFEQSFSRFPLPGTRARSWYLAAGGALAGAAPRTAGSNVFTWNAAARPLTSFTGDTGAGPGRLVDRDAGLPVAAQPGGHRVVLPDSTAERQHGRHRRGRGPAVDQGLGAERRPAGHRHRSPSRRPGDVRAGRLAARERAQARRGPEHAAGAGAEPAPRRRVAAAARALDRGHGAAVLRGPRLPRRIAHPHHRRRARGRSARVVVRADEPAWDGHRLGGLLAAPALAADPPGGPRRQGPDGPAALPRPARRALPRL